MGKSKVILNFDSKQAREFFLKEESYCNFNLPPYIQCEPLLKAINKEFDKAKDWRNLIKIKKVENSNEVNYKIFNNKNGKYDWRIFELINPVIYVYLVREITDEKNWNVLQKHFRKSKSVKCHSIPVRSQSKKSDKAEQISQWWEKIEQESIKYSLEFEYLFNTDITNFYPSIYTHSIPWALHGKENAKSNKNDYSLLGNVIDKYIRLMSYGQTNGIPQGSVLMDFIAEILLKYIDNSLSKSSKSKGSNFKIIRYRDDYRIFVNNPQDADLILKNLSIILANNGLKLNPNKTTSSCNVVKDSIKKDKVEWLFVESSLKESKTLQKQFIILYKFALKHQNSGTLEKVLHRCLKDFQSKSTQRQNKLFKTSFKKENIQVLVAILVDIAAFNPRVYPVAMGILGILFDKIKNKEFIEKTISKLEKLYNNAYMEIWLQRAILKLEIDYEFDEKICKQVKNMKFNNNDLWDMDWLECKTLKKIIKKHSIINKDEIKQLEKYTKPDEVSVFEY